jgi:hypothetical protein
MSDNKAAAPADKDFWDKLQIVFHPVGGLLTAVTVALLGYYTTNILRSNEAATTRKQVYTELMSSREQADSSLRKDMFLSIIETFQRSEKSSLEGKMLNLELLTYNFHDSLNLKPLFAHMGREITAATADPNQASYRARLNQIGRDISTRQLVLLEQVGKKFSRSVDFDKLKAEGILELAPEKLTLADHEREFTLSVLAANPQTHEIRVEMGVRTLNGTSTLQLRKFQVGDFDFPMIDNTRLSSDQRAAVVITQAGESSAEITLVYFPGSYASLKEKVSYDEVVEQLVGTQSQN